MKRTLILMRHAEPGENGLLTRKGEQQARSMAMQFLAAGMRPDLIIHSPLPRAQATAALVEETYKEAGHIIPVRIELGLVNEPEELEKSLTWLADEKAVIAIGHEPQIRYAVETLLGREWRPRHATAAVIEMDGSDWSGILTFGRGHFRTQYAPA